MKDGKREKKKKGRREEGWEGGGERGREGGVKKNFANELQNTRLAESHFFFFFK